MKKKLKTSHSKYSGIWRAARLEGVVKNRGIKKKKKRPTRT